MCTSQIPVQLHANSASSSMQSTVLQKFINLLMKDGKKCLALRIFYDVLQKLSHRITKQNESTHESAKETACVHFVLFHAIECIQPSLEVRKVRVAGSTYMVPSILSRKKQQSMAIKWILSSAKKRKKTSMQTFADCLADEILDAFHKQGSARQKRDALHASAEVNRAYLRYRWW